MRRVLESILATTAAAALLAGAGCSDDGGTTAPPGDVGPDTTADMGGGDAEGDGGPGDDGVSDDMAGGDGVSDDMAGGDGVSDDMAGGDGTGPDTGPGDTMDDGGGGQTTTLTLSVSDLPALGDSHVYEGWVAGGDLQDPVSTGTFSVNEAGEPDPSSFDVATADVAAAANFVVSIEPADDDDPAPSQTKILAGTMQDGAASLTIGHQAALGSDFMEAAGSYILNTPTTPDVVEDYDQGIWWLDPSGGEPTASLDLPELPEGWMYEGWVVDTSGDSPEPISTGRFTEWTSDSGEGHQGGADTDGAGDASGDGSFPPFPGQDFIDPARMLANGDYKAVISVEPAPDNSEAPFALKPLVDQQIHDVFPMDGNPIFDEGESASSGLEGVAEAGTPSGNDAHASLVDELSGAPHVAESGAFGPEQTVEDPNDPTGEVPGAPPIAPGGAFEFQVVAAPGQRLSFATMFVPSNDLFFAPDEDGIPLFFPDGEPVEGDVTEHVHLWDAGTEPNQEPGFGDVQAPAQDGPDAGDDEGANVRKLADVDDGYDYPTAGEAIHVSVSPVDEGDNGTLFDVRVENVAPSDFYGAEASTGGAIWITPGAYAIHAAGGSQFMTNAADEQPSGLVTAEGTETVTMEMSTSGVPSLGDNAVYEGWVVDTSGDSPDPVSTGTFTVNDGTTEPITFDVPVADVRASDLFVVSIEPADDEDPDPAATKFLAGPLAGATAHLGIRHPAALGTDFRFAAGEYVLNTPTTPETQEDYDQGIWWLQPGDPPSKGLRLPTLPEGWMYEGWVVDTSGDSPEPISTGRFTEWTSDSGEGHVGGADTDGAGDAAGPGSEFPPFPGQDFIDPARMLANGDYQAVISVEPAPDDSAAPFALKPLVDPTIEDVNPMMGGTQHMENMSDDPPAAQLDHVSSSGSGS